MLSKLRHNPVPGTFRQIWHDFKFLVLSLAVFSVFSFSELRSQKLSVIQGHSLPMRPPIGLPSTKMMNSILCWWPTMPKYLLRLHCSSSWWGRKVLQWKPCNGRRGGLMTMLKLQEHVGWEKHVFVEIESNRSKWRCLGETYIHQWTYFSCNEDNTDKSHSLFNPSKGWILNTHSCYRMISYVTLSWFNSDCSVLPTVWIHATISPHADVVILQYD